MFFVTYINAFPFFSLGLFHLIEFRERMPAFNFFGRKKTLFRTPRVSSRLEFDCKVSEECRVKKGRTGNGK